MGYKFSIVTKECGGGMGGYGVKIKIPHWTRRYLKSDAKNVFDIPSTPWNATN